MVAGMLYGLGIWLVSYGGWVPKFGLTSQPNGDPPESQASIAAGHAVYACRAGRFTRLALELTTPNTTLGLLDRREVVCSGSG